MILAHNVTNGRAFQRVGRDVVRCDPVNAGAGELHERGAHVLQLLIQTAGLVVMTRPPVIAVDDGANAVE